MGEDQGSCLELGTATKNPPVYGERHVETEDAANWGDPPLHDEQYRKANRYKSK
jgi:hypothetical protein